MTTSNPARAAEPGDRAIRGRVGLLSVMLFAPLALVSLLLGQALTHDLQTVNARWHERARLALQDARSEIGDLWDRLPDGGDGVCLLQLGASGELTVAAWGRDVAQTAPLDEPDRSFLSAALLLFPLPQVQAESIAPVAAGRLDHLEAELDWLHVRGLHSDAAERVRRVVADQDPDAPDADRGRLLAIAANSEWLAGSHDRARLAWRRIVSECPGGVDTRGLPQGFAAAWLLSRSMQDELPVPVVWYLLGQYRLGIDSRQSVAQTALGTHTRRIRELFDDVVKRLPTVERARAMEAMDRLEATDHERDLLRRVVAAIDQPLRSNVAAGVPGNGIRIVPTADPLAVSELGPGAETHVAAVREQGDGYRVGVCSLSAFRTRATQVLATGQLHASGFRFLLRSEAPPETGILISEQAPFPFDGERLVVVTPRASNPVTDDRRRVWQSAGLAGIGVLVAVVAAAFTIRSVVREEQASQSRARFITGVTHELKTPLTSVRLLAELLEKGVDGPKSHEFAARIVEETSRLSRLVENVLEMARSRATEVSRHAVTLNAEDVVRAVVRSMEHLHDEKRRPDLLLNTPVACVFVDPDGLHRAVTALLDNSLRYAGTLARIELEVRGPKDGRVEVVVRDDGPGFDSMRPDELFEEFARGERETTAQSPGSGLGLSLVRAFARLSNGTATAHNRPGGGAEVILSLPAVAKQGSEAGDGDA